LHIGKARLREAIERLIVHLLRFEITAKSN
jgi:hypothetical protein